MITIKVGDKEYKVKEAKTDTELENGLKGIKELPEDEGMLFYMPDEQSQQVFTMEDMEIPLDIIFINQDQEVVSVRTDCEPEQKYVISETDYLGEGDYIAYVLEVNINSGINVGDSIDFNEEGPTMKVLAQDGSTQMELWGGERIFSRKNTVILIKKAKKADLSKDDKDYKALGKYMFKCINTQDTRQPEYVSIKE